MDEKKSFMQTALAATKDMIGPPAPLVPFADWDYYYVRGPVTWKSPEHVAIYKQVEVPIGFVTDLASIPRVFWSILPRQARYTYPAIIHDYLYWMQGSERGDADEILRQAMKDMDVSTAQIFTIYQAVRIAGGGAWASNAAAKQAGEKRILKEFPSDLKTTWLDWKIRPDVFQNGQF